MLTGSVMEKMKKSAVNSLLFVDFRNKLDLKSV